MFLYHATSTEKAFKIIQDGKMNVENNNFIHLADSENNALKFMVFEFGKPEVVIFKIMRSELDELFLEESHDHLELFFKCKAWLYKSDISTEAVANIVEYRRKFSLEEK